VHHRVSRGPMSGRIFLGSLIHPVKQYCLPSWIASLAHIDDVDDIVLANTSNNPQFKSYTEGIPYTTLHAPGMNTFQSISAGRAALFERFLATDCTHFFSLECDVFAQSHIAVELLQSSKEIVSVPYVLGYMYEPERRLKDDFLLSVTDERRIHLTSRELLEQARGRELVQVNEAGLGCSLIERQVIEKYTPTVSCDRLDDQAFYKFCRSQRIPRFARIDLMPAVQHYPHFHMEYGVHAQFLARRGTKGK
jgi:hypothetical protein